MKENCTIKLETSYSKKMKENSERRETSILNNDAHKKLQVIMKAIYDQYSANYL